MEIFAVKIPKVIASEHFNELLLLLDKEKQMTLREMKSQHSVMEALTSALLLRYLIRIKRGSDDGVNIETNEFGKPYLKNDPHFHFNLSHSDEWVICAIDTAPIGVDIEKIDYQQPKIVLDVLSPAEANAYQRLPIDDRVNFFYTIWVRKESYIKSIGVGLNIPLDSIDVFSQEREHTVVPAVGGSVCQHFFIRHFLIEDGYSMALCAGHENFPKQITFIDSQELYFPVEEKLSK